MDPMGIVYPSRVPDNPDTCRKICQKIQWDMIIAIGIGDEEPELGYISLYLVL